MSGDELHADRKSAAPAFSADGLSHGPVPRFLSLGFFAVSDTRRGHESRRKPEQIGKEAVAGRGQHIERIAMPGGRRRECRAHDQVDSRLIHPPLALPHDPRQPVSELPVFIGRPAAGRPHHVARVRLAHPAQRAGQQRPQPIGRR